MAQAHFGRIEHSLGDRRCGHRREIECRMFVLYCGLLANCLTTSAHFTISPRRYLSNSAGVIDIGIAPCVAQSLTTSGRLTTSFTAALSLSMIGFGVPAGAIKPSQMVAS